MPDGTTCGEWLAWHDTFLLRNGASIQEDLTHWTILNTVTGIYVPLLINTEE